ncbi:MAG: type II toxin-antitoxin system VapC family toxin [Propionibacteriaceae bacterium]|jgi:PIN domain nuclease of toxin-antitoxin system|nr:type II toxin-antitoxin system VapC family toxin [Propionibacteriaceae bacterium]
MRLLADTHTLLWLARESQRLSPLAKTLLADAANEVLLSAASVWELSVKRHLGKLPEAAPVIDGFAELTRRFSARPLSMSPAHARLAGALDWSHRDPFDRMLAAQAILESATLVSCDEIFDQIPDLRRLW